MNPYFRKFEIEPCELWPFWKSVFACEAVRAQKELLKRSQLHQALSHNYTLLKKKLGTIHCIEIIVSVGDNDMWMFW